MVSFSYLFKCIKISARETASPSLLPSESDINICIKHMFRSGLIEWLSLPAHHSPKVQFYLNRESIGSARCDDVPAKVQIYEEFLVRESFAFVRKLNNGYKLSLAKNFYYTFFVKKVTMR